MRDLQELFWWGMMREVPPLLQPPAGLAFDVGASGLKKAPGAVALGLPEWSWPRDRIPAEDSTVAVIHAYHFMEHLSGEDAIAMLREFERVLVPGGVVNFCIPYYNSNLWAHDLTHKSQWCEDSFTNLFKNDYYDPAGAWKLRQHFCVIMGVVERNTVIIGQLTKDA
jgi:hypothetical protein